MENMRRYAWRAVLLWVVSCGNGPATVSNIPDGTVLKNTGRNIEKYISNIKAGKYKIRLAADDPGKLIVSSPRKKSGGAGIFTAKSQNLEVDSIWLNLTEVRLVSKTGSIITVSNQPRQINLLEIKDDAATLFADAFLPQGSYTQIRLVLAADNGYVVKDGQQFPLKVPSGAQSGLKIDGEFTIVSGLILKLVLDFSVDSLHWNQGQGYMLKPVTHIREIETMLPFVECLLLIKLKNKVSISPGSFGQPNVTGITSIDNLNQKHECGIITNFLEYLQFSNLDHETAAKVGLDRVYVFTFRDQTDILAAMLDYANDANVEQVYPDTWVNASLTPNDPQANPVSGAQRFYLNDINAYNGWDTTTGAANITVAVVDTGVDHQHPDLAGKVTLGDSFTMGWCSYTPSCPVGCACDTLEYRCPIRGNKNSTDVEQHGTHVAGTIGAMTNNGAGIAGINWQSQILSIRTFDSFGFSSESAIGAGIIEAASQGARVINMSFRGFGYDICYENGACRPSHPAESAAVEYAYARGVVLVAATGNDATRISAQPGSPTQMAAFPASFPNVIAVGALNTGTISRASFSNFGKVDIMAPGTSIYSTIPNSGYAFFSGTSMATPQVAGLASLILSRNNKLLPEQVARAIYTTAIDINSGVDPNPQCIIAAGYDNCTGWGRINIAAAVNSVIVVPIPVDNGDGTITDVTSLMWMKCSLGQNLTDPSCAGGATDYTWSNAFPACENLNFAGYTDWRLPTRDELNSLITCANGNSRPPADNISKCYQLPTGNVNINTTYFPNTPAGFFTSIYWTATDFGACGPSNFLRPCPWVTVFDPGGTGYGYNAINPGKVRCVRHQ